MYSLLRVLIVILYHSMGDTTTVPTTISTNCSSYGIINETSGVVTYNIGILAIPRGAFSNCSALIRTVLPDSVTSIGQYAYYNCDKLVSIHVPDSVVVIESYAFSLTSSLENTHLPDSVTFLGPSVFERSALTQVLIPRRVVTVPELAFAHAHLSIVTFHTEVTTINEFAFENTVLESVTIPTSVTFIGAGAFQHVTTLQTVSGLNGDNITAGNASFAFTGITALPTFSHTMSNISDYMFYNSSALTLFNIPDAVISIGERAFSRTSLSTILIPDSVARIFSHAFSDNQNLQSVTFSESASQVTYIGPYAFANTGIRRLDLPAAVRDLGDGAFSSMGSLTIINAEQTSNLNISNTTFANCASLQTVTLNPQARVQIGAFPTCFGYGLHTSANRSYESSYYYPIIFASTTCLPGFGNITIGDDVVAVGAGSYKDVATITSVYLSDTVTVIGNGAFQNTMLRNVVMSAVVVVQSSAFSNNTDLATVSVSPFLQFIGNGSFSGCVALKSIALPNTLTYIGPFAFSGCSTLSAVGNVASATNCILLPANANLTIGSLAFSGCEQLLNLTIPDSISVINQSSFSNMSITTVYIGNNVTVIGSKAFEGCKSLEDVVMPNSVMRIGQSVFSECGSLQYAILSEQLTSIGAYAFANTSSLTSIQLPLSVTVIGNYAFMTSGLQSCTLPNTLQSIGSASFQHCEGLSSITIPASVTTIGASAFGGCIALSSINIPDSLRFIPSEAFSSGVAADSVSALTNVTIADSVQTLGTAAFARTNISEILIPDSVTSIGPSAFRGCVHLKSVTISNSNTSIGRGAFASCDSLSTLNISYRSTESGMMFPGCSGDFTVSAFTSVVVPDSVTTLGSNAFSGCTALQSVSLSNTVSLLNNSAFASLSSLTEVNATSVRHIGSLAFSRCVGLTDIRLSDVLTYIGAYAFQICINLTSIWIPTSVTYVGENAFFGCNLCLQNQSQVALLHSTKKATFRDNITVIGRYSFYNCNNLTRIQIPNSVKMILPLSISYSTLLNNVVIPDSVRSIESTAFEGCRALNTIVIPNTVNVSSGTVGPFFGCGCEQTLFKPGTALQNCQRGYIQRGSWTAWTVCDNMTSYQTTAPTYTSDRICTSAIDCVASQQYVAIALTATTGRTCTEYTACAHGISAPGTTTTDRKCHQRLGLTGAQGAAIAIGVESLVIIVIALVMYLLYRKKNRTEKDLHLRELLLQDERAEKESLYAENTQMKRAWEIAEGDLVMECVIASGASASVWRAKWGHISVAVKVLKHPIDDDFDPLAGEDFNREVSFMQRLRHPNLLTFYGAGVTLTKSAFMVVELMSEGSMRTVLLSQRLLTASERVAMALDVARGMRQLHSAGCLHRDLKSDNCLVDENLRVKVADFGASRLLDIQTTRRASMTKETKLKARASGALDESNQSSTGSVSSVSMTQGVGTPLWMAPELVEEVEEYGGEVDVYSYGIVLWEVLTRATPWELEIPCQGIAAAAAIRKAVSSGQRPTVPKTPDLPTEYVSLMRECWTGDPAKRPDFAKIVDVLEAITV
eukprot:m.832182 g.832182  ORF g.832182 m.832182 type:complete len:1540 (+) comp23434_c1_seq2:167-4786(+)